MRPRHIVILVIVFLVVVGAWQGRKRFAPPIAPPPAAQTPAPAAPAVPDPVTSVPAPRPDPMVATPKPAPTPIPKKAVVSKKPAVVPSPAPTARATPQKPPIVPVRPVPPPPPPQEWKGNSDTSIKRVGQIVVQNETQWVRFWAEHHPHEVSPDVDFSRNMVVGVFLGQRPADGFSVEITGARILPDALSIEYVERAPPPGTFQIAVEAYPFHVKVIPKSTQRVKFTKLTAEYVPDPTLRRSTPTAAP